MIRLKKFATFLIFFQELEKLQRRVEIMYEDGKTVDHFDFAKKMLKQEQCNSLESQVKITNWCREWEKSHPAG